MKEHFMKGLMLGLGLASLAAKDAKKRIETLVREGTVNRKHAEKLLRDVRAYSHRHRKTIEKQAMAESVKQVAAFKKISRREIASLRRTLARLEKRL